jgi:hypothetical protein
MKRNQRLGIRRSRLLPGLVPPFLWGILLLGERLRPRRFVTRDCWNLPQAMNALRSRVYKPKRHSTGDSGAFLFL